MTARQRLPDVEITDHLTKLPGWELQHGALHRELTFNDFSEAFAFMTRVAMLAEQMDHHPNWSNVYRTVRIALSTHDVGGISQRDFDLAHAINRLVD